MQLTISKAIFCSLYWLFMFMFYDYRVKHKRLGTENSCKGYILFAVLLSTYAVFDFTGGDFYGYYNLYENSKLYGSTFHMEPVYGFLIEHTQNYFQWRLAVWGVSALLWVLMVRRLKLDVDYSALMLLLLVFYNFVGGRQTLGFCCLLYGVTLFFTSDKKQILKFTLAVAIISCSLFFHRTMIVYCIVLIISMIPFKKYGIIILLVLFPILSMYFDAIVGNFVDVIGKFTEDSSSRIQYYLDSDFRTRANIYGKIRYFIERVPVILLLAYSVYDVFFQKSRQPYLYESLLRMTFVMIYISFLFEGKEVSAYISPRFWDASLFPLTLFVSYYLFNRRKKSFVTFCTVLLVFAKLFNVAYEIYSI